MERTLTITTNEDWKASLRGASKAARIGMKRGTYQGETLNFETPGAFFSHLTANRWAMLNELQKAGPAVSVRELARRLDRDVRRVHDDVVGLAELGLVERADDGVLCPYSDIHVDMHVSRLAA